MRSIIYMFFIRIIDFNQEKLHKMKQATTWFWESLHSDGFARGDFRLIESGENTRVELDFEYTLHHGWMQKIARLVSHFGFPSLAFDHGLARIKGQIEKQYL